jgi:hypothetical protein
MEFFPKSRLVLEKALGKDSIANEKAAGVDRELN